MLKKFSNILSPNVPTPNIHNQPSTLPMLLSRKVKENILPGRPSLQDALYRGTCSAADSLENAPYHIYLGRYINGYEGGKAHDGSLAGGLPVVAPQDLENNAQATLRAKYNT